MHLVRRVSSISFGVTLLIIIFTYSSIGSALPPVRQGALADWLGLELLRFEKTEMEWFNWWPFQLMIALLCLGMLLATLRIKLRLSNAGVWAIHSGIIILGISSAAYFGAKVEGDAVIFHSRALVKLPGMSTPAEFVIRPDAQLTVGEPGRRYHIRVADLDPRHVLAAGPAKGKQTPVIWLSITNMDTGQRFARRLLLGYPELSEDFRVEGNSVTPISTARGHKLIDDQLQIHLWYDPAEYFYLHDTAAIYARFSPDEEWTQLRVDDVPHYHEYVDDHSAVWSAGNLATRPLNLAARAEGKAEHLDGIDVRLTGFLPYAETRARWLPGGQGINPLLRIRVQAPFAESTEQLLARVPGHDLTRLPTGQTVQFSWAASETELADMLKRPEPLILVHFQGASAPQGVSLAELQEKGSIPLQQGGYSISLKRQMAAGAAGTNTPAAVLVEISKPGQSFHRAVFEGRGDGGLDLDQSMTIMPEPIGTDISLEYVDSWQDRVLLVASDDSGEMHAIRTSADGQFEQRSARIGEAVAAGSNLQIVPEQIVARAYQEVRPYVVPRNQRQPASLARQSLSQVRVEIRQGDWSDKAWLRYHDYAFRDAQRAQPGRFIYDPVSVDLPDGRKLELLYSRWRERLPAPVALDRFVLETYPGGDQPSDYISRVRFLEQGQWSDITEVRSNQPAQHGEFWYFQSQYDPRTHSHTVLGVGNRVAVGWMLAGVCLSIAGMLYAFYIKPVLRRRGNAAQQVPAQDAQVDDAPVRALVGSSDALVK